MIETLTLITLSVLFLIFFRPGKTPPLANQLTIERPGQYHITLAAQLNLAQPFIEDIARQLGTSGSTGQDSTTQCFEVRDKNVTAHGHDFYLLAITQRNGMLYFQAARPQSEDPSSQYKTISAFAASVLARVPPAASHNAGANERIVAATAIVAQQCQIEIKRLPA